MTRRGANMLETFLWLSTYLFSDKVFDQVNKGQKLKS